jgi:AcrR family transcriptional regulator
MARKADPNRKTNIIRAAMQVFAQKGYAAARIVDVAVTAGMGKGTIYQYFKGKEDLFFAVFQHVMQESDVPVAAALAAEHGSVSEKLRAITDSLITLWLEKIELYSLTMEFWSATTAHVGRERFRTSFQTAYQMFREEMAALIAEGVRQGEFLPDCRPYEVAAGLIGILDALVLQTWLDNSFDALKVARVCLDTLLRGLRTPQHEEAI